MSQPDQSADHRESVLAVLEAYERPLLRYALRLVRDEHTARDIVQHAFLKLCEQSITTVDNVRPWLYRVCRNKAMDILRTKGRRGQENGEFQMLEDATDGPADAAEQRDLHACLSRLIQQLSIDHQELLQLWSNGLRFKEIAEATKRTEVGVRVAIYRLFGQLRQDSRVRSLLAGELPAIHEAQHE